MNTKQLKKQLILNIPYIILGLLATNLGEAWRIAAGVNASEKVQSLVLDGVFATAFSNPLPSLYPADLLVGNCLWGSTQACSIPERKER